MRRSLAAGERVSGIRFALLRPDGERREVIGSSIPVMTAEGAPVGVVTVLTDLTERLSLETQFRHAQKMEALGRLAGGIAHDFNNVLMAIQGYAEMIARASREGSVSPDHADQVLTAAHRAIELTARLNTFARREVRQLQAVEVAEMIEQVQPLIRQLAPESVDLVMHLERGPSVLLDRSEFEQVLINLVVNALDAMPDGGRLTIEAGAVHLDRDYASSHLGESEGLHVLVAVSDTGIGMDEQTRSRIFEPFYTTKPVGEGTGLGLAMAFAAVERVGGRIWVYSEPSHGTTFKIYLPPVEPATTAEPRVPELVAPAVGGSESILLLEDDALVRDLLVTVLRDLGYAVAVASRPSEALALATDRRFDLLVSDIVMPEMMGDAVAAALRLSQPDLSVVFMSGYTARALDFELGPRDVLVSKPLRITDVARTVREALDRSKDRGT
jgi:signal transduction histidine kinase